MHSTVTEGFVLVTPHNTFVGTSRVSSHGGYRACAHEVDSIARATVFTHYIERDMQRAIDVLFPTTSKLPVTVTRTVTLVTEELNFNLLPEVK